MECRNLTAVVPLHSLPCVHWKPHQTVLSCWPPAFNCILKNPIGKNIVYYTPRHLIMLLPFISVLSKFPPGTISGNCQTKFCLENCFSLISNVSFCSDCFQHFLSLVLVFGSLIVVCLGMDFIELILFEGHWASWSVDLCLSPNLETFGSLFLQEFFNTQSLFFSFHIVSPVSGCSLLLLLFF